MKCTKLCIFQPRSRLVCITSRLVTETWDSFALCFEKPLRQRLYFLGRISLYISASLTFLKGCNSSKRVTTFIWKVATSRPLLFTSINRDYLLSFKSPKKNSLEYHFFLNLSSNFCCILILNYKDHHKLQGLIFVIILPLSIHSYTHHLWRL